MASSISEVNDSHVNVPSLEVLGNQFLCKIWGQSHLSGTTIQNIAMSTNYFLEQTLASVNRKVGEILDEFGTCGEEKKRVDRVFSEAAQEISFLGSPGTEISSRPESNPHLPPQIVSLSQGL